MGVPTCVAVASGVQKKLNADNVTSLGSHLWFFERACPCLVFDAYLISSALLYRPKPQCTRCSCALNPHQERVRTMTTIFWGFAIKFRVLVGLLLGI